MKNYQSYLWAAATAVVSVSLVGCDDDDDKGGGSTFDPTTSAEAMLFNGKHLTSVGNTHFTYGDNGELTQIVDEYDVATVTHNPLTITESWKDEYGSGSGKCVYEFNSNGYISRIREECEGKVEDVTWTEITSVVLTYNSNGQLVEVVCESNESGVDQGEKYSEVEKDVSTLSYSGTKLEKVTAIGTDIVDGKLDDSWSFTATMEYGDNPTPNKFAQYTRNIGDYIIPVGYCLENLGLFGKASSVLPDKIIFEDSDGDDWYSTCSYELDEDGLITYADGYQYRYDEPNNTGKSRCYVEPNVAESSNLNKKLPRFGPGKHGKHRK